ncbi:ribulose-phosphate 3-epimerase [uncultured Clostridium sp.]|jgi:ribulose-phosphate 3-epimerase|uniref:ribulose-phosphate 3-epimerase n=1 Tax=uncultured Clostridium sp. TaxID=59620 RepID=UPI0025DCD790|nr:ribulose-phosphate 3-epimerase [uncultured Clostridium sp.]
MTEISASILNLEEENATKKMYNLETAKIDYFHIDVMDGKFVKNNNLELMKNYALTVSHISNLGIDVHLMVENVEEYVEEYLDLNPQIITFHIEASKSEERTQKIIDLIKQNGSRVGLAISPDTDLENIKPYLKYIHLVLVMTVVPGLGGQKLIPETLEKVCELKKYIEENNIDIDIEVDGGINDITAKEATQAGANILVVGKYLITSDNLSETVNKLKGGK